MNRAEQAGAILLAGVAVVAGAIWGILDLCARGQDADEQRDG